MIKVKLDIEDIETIDEVIREKGHEADFYKFCDDNEIKEKEINHRDYLNYLISFIPSIK